MKKISQRIKLLLWLFFGMLVSPVFAVYFLNNLDGTISDRKNGLVWQRCSMGGCGTETKTTWANALTYCNGLQLAGRTWRLPNINELISIADKTKFPAIDTTIFPGTYTNGYMYWSSSTFLGDTTRAWVVASEGQVTAQFKTNGLYQYVRCVATGP